MLKNKIDLFSKITFIIYVIALLSSAVYSVVKESLLTATILISINTIWYVMVVNLENILYEIEKTITNKKD